GLRHIVIGAEFESHDLVDLRVLGREHDDRHIRLRTQLTAHLGAGDAGQHEIEQDEIGAAAVEFRQSLQSVIGDRHLVPFLTEQVRQRVRERVLVLDEQNTSHVVSFLCSLPSVRSWGEPPCLRDEPASSPRSAPLAARSSPLPTSPPSALSSAEGALSRAEPVPSLSPVSPAEAVPSGPPALPPPPAEAVPANSAECSMRTPCGAASLASW